MLSAEYLAGFFDGEGCVSIGTTKGSHGQVVGGYLAVVLANSNVDLLRIIQEEHGGSLHQRSTGSWSLKMTTRTAVAFLKFIVPHLLVKEEVALAGIALGTRPKEDPMCSEREQLRRLIHELNRRTSPRAGPKSRFEI